MSKLLSIIFFLPMFLVLLSVNLVHGQTLSSTFYDVNCPDLEGIVRRVTTSYILPNPTLAAPLLRMHFHDCFVRGCDGSVLLNSTAIQIAEKDAIPNLSLRGYEVIDAVKLEVEAECPGIVSCADILALVARDAVHLINGPFWSVELGRRDGTVSQEADALANLPPFFANINTLKDSWIAKGLTVQDLVVLSGAHTIGVGHCSSFSYRLYNFTGKGDTDPSMDPFYIAALKLQCKPDDTTKAVEMDPLSSIRFDTNYYRTVSSRRGLFESDNALRFDPETKAYMDKQIRLFGSTFFSDFGVSMRNMGRIGVLTGNAGQIRNTCSVIN